MIRNAKRAAPGLVLLASFALAGCPGSDGTVVYDVGARPATAALESTLVIGRSTPDEVARALGEPSGKGATMLPVLDEHPRETWTYYFENGRVRSGPGGELDVDARRAFLFVYFDAGRYDGYMWFSSLVQ